VNVMTILGTRPEIIRLSLIIPLLDQYAENHVLVHTGQNFTYSLSEVFFEQLQLRQPNYILQDRQQSLGGQLSTMFIELEKLFIQEKPDLVLVLGDTNSALSSILAERMGISVIHMEAGNRCFDWSVPEEKNRKVIDAISTINMPYTSQSKDNLIREGIPIQRIMVSGNPIYEVLLHYEQDIAQSRILETLGLTPNQYFLVTAHRAENVDHPGHLTEIINGLNLVAEAFGQRIICSIHPRTKSRIDSTSSLQLNPLIEFYEPFGFFDFVRLEKHTRCAITDSGTVQEECCLFHIPTVTTRNSTERPETIECGSNTVTGLNANQILEAVKLMVQLPTDWVCPQGYLETNVSMKVIKFMLGGKRHVR
jgi:UDP-N-acetylglucosamine 2-epimerase (non-hydrolysing)